MFDDMVHVGHDLHQLGYHLHATDLTHNFFKEKGVPTTLVKFPGAEVPMQRIPIECVRCVTAAVCGEFKIFFCGNKLPLLENIACEGST